MNGCLVECKLIIDDIFKALFQTIKYCSKFRIEGKPVPANILLVSLNEGICYHYHSKDYLADIEKIYNGQASKNNEGFIAQEPLRIFDYDHNDLDFNDLRDVMKEDKFTKVHVDLSNIIGLHNEYFKMRPMALKCEFIGEEEDGRLSVVGEIRKPTILHYIYPYEKKNNDEFKLVMDQLNAKSQKKDLGAYYTPLPYVKFVTETLLQQAIDRVPEGNDYVIIDNCAGSGNLLRYCSDEILSHYIISTYEFYEYLCLYADFGTKVRAIIPPYRDRLCSTGLLEEANALSEDYINNPVIKKYVDDPKCTIIMNINPPYSEGSSAEAQKEGRGKESSKWKETYVGKEAMSFKYEDRLSGANSNEMANAFIWSAFHHYLRQDTDSLIVYSPLKYWKNSSWMNQKFINGYLFNRKYFGDATETSLGCILWSKEKDNISEIELSCYDISKMGELVDMDKKVKVKRVYSKFSDIYYDKREFSDDIVENKPAIKGDYPLNPKAIWCATNGVEAFGKKLPLIQNIMIIL